MNAYQELSQRFRRLGLLSDALSVLSWDTAAMMPDGAAPARAEQTATLCHFEIGKEKVDCHAGKYVQGKNAQ